MTKLLRSQPLTHRSDVPASLRPRKALQAEAPKLAYDPGCEGSDDAPGPKMQPRVWRGAFFIVGYEVSPNAPSEVGSLLLAAYQKDEIVYIGRVRADLNAAEARSLRKMLDMLRWKRKTSPVQGEIATFNGVDIAWAYPTLIADVTVSAWASDGVIERAAYQGLAARQDNADVFRLDRLRQAGQTHSRR